MASLIHFDYERPGKGLSTFEQWLVIDRPDVQVVLLERYAGRPMFVGDTLVQAPGAPIVWYVFPDTWYDIGRFHRANHTFTGWYTNLCTPFEVAGNRWRSTDLFLDHWLPVSGGAGEWLDEDEHQDAVKRDLLTPAQCERIVETRQAVDRQLAGGGWPPPATREISLQTVLARHRSIPRNAP